MAKIETSEKFALIGAGPMGLAMAKVLQEQGIPFQGFELHSDVGGLWDIEGARSTMYDSAHLISSKKMTEFRDFPMDESVAEYPSHSELKRYFQKFAKRYKIYDKYLFNSEVISAEPLGASGEGWKLVWRDAKGKEKSGIFAGLMIANGTLSEPNFPGFTGKYTGELLHSAQYRDPKIFDGKRVLIVGAGNSGCDSFANPFRSRCHFRPTG